MAKAKRSSLGKGLGNLFGEDVMKQSRIEEQGDIPQMHVKLSSIEPNRGQPRKKFDETAIQELSESIKQYGILQPLLVKKQNDYYEIIAGERRWRAAKLAGLMEVPVVIVDFNKQQSMEAALIENVQREDLNAIEEAKAYQQLIEEFDLTQEEIAVRVSKNRATITNTLRLLKLDDRIQQMLIEQLISSGHARSLLAIENKEDQYIVALKIVDHQLSVREVEKLVKAFYKEPKKKKEEKDKTLELIFKELEERMKQVMGTKVNINKRDRYKGKIEIEYYSEAELERLVELIESIK